MNIKTILFPRQLEADGVAEKIRAALDARKVRLYSGGTLNVPVVAFNDALISALRKARMQSRIRVGLDEILEKLAAEKKGLDELREKTATVQGERMSRLLLFSNDGAERFYGNIEKTLIRHDPRVLGCMIEADENALGRMLIGKTGKVKVILIDHKDAVSDILRSMA